MHWLATTRWIACRGFDALRYVSLGSEAAMKFAAEGADALRRMLSARLNRGPARSPEPPAPSLMD